MFQIRGNYCVRWKLGSQGKDISLAHLWFLPAIPLGSPTSFIFLLRSSTDFMKFGFNLVSKINCSRGKGIEIDVFLQSPHLLFLETKIYEGILWEPSALAYTRLWQALCIILSIFLSCYLLPWPLKHSNPYQNCIFLCISGMCIWM